jgi:hypothetical protein
MLNQGRKKRLSRSVRTHIRREKAKIRRKSADEAERERLLAEFYASLGLDRK